jgi:hypothetical protein
VSLLRLNELRVGLCPDRLIIARFRGGFGRRLIEHRVAPIKAGPGEALKQLAANHRVSVVLSNHFIRYAVLPWSSTLTSERDWAAFAQHNFVSIYGDVAKTWEFCVSRTKRGHPAITCAVDAALLQSLRQIPGIASVQPYLMAAFNARRKALPGPSLWFVVQERGRMTVALIVDGKWKAIRNRQAREGWHESLSDYLDREAAACGDKGTDCAAVCSEEEPPKQVGRYRILDVTLPRNADLTLRPIRMALSA